MSERRRKHWGWGHEEDALSGEALRGAAAFLHEHLGFGSREPAAPVPLSAVRLRPSRLQPPAAFAPICDGSDHARARHALGSSYRDVVRGFRGEFDHPPDVVARPGDETQLTEVLEWAIDAGAAVIPYGGGTSVVGGVEGAVPERYRGVVTIDLKALNRVLEIDRVSRISSASTG